MIEKLMSGFSFDYDDKLVKSTFPKGHFNLLHVEILDNIDIDFTKVKEKVKMLPVIHFVPIVQNRSEITFLVNFHPYDFSHISQKLKEVAGN
ncbi:hypothetical protein ACI2OX_05720 [Bacillus sp. N9]